MITAPPQKCQPVAALEGHYPKSSPAAKAYPVLHGNSTPSSWNPAVFKPDHKPARRFPAIAGFNFSGDNSQTEPTIIPGIGLKKPDCGEWVRKLRSKDQVRDIYHSCDTLSCPVCVDSAITKKARDAAEHFDHYESAKLQENAVLIPGEHRRAIPRHIIFSPSPAHTAELWKKGGKTHAGFLQAAREELREMNKLLVAGRYVYHANRVKHPDTGLTGKEAKALLTREAKLSGNMTDESPASDLYKHIRKQKNWQDYFYFFPHFHIVGFGTLPSYEEFSEMFPGWIYSNKGNVPNVGGLLRYLYSHMAMIEGCHSTVPFGRMGTAVLGTEELRTTYQDVICDETGLPWVIEDSILPDEIGKNYQEMITEYRAFFREKRKRGPAKMKFPKSETTRRRAVPAGVHEKGILALVKYCDEYGRL